MARVTKKGGSVYLSVYSDKALDAQKKWYALMNFKTVKENNGYYLCYNSKLKLYFISERFSKTKLLSLFNQDKFLTKVTPCSSIGYFIKSIKI